MRSTNSPLLGNGIQVRETNLILPRFGDDTTNGDGRSAMVPTPIAYSVLSGGAVASVKIVHGGGKYTVAPDVVFTKQSTAGANAAGTAVIDSDGYVTSVTITNAGSGYEVPPLVSFTNGTTPTGYIRESGAEGIKFNVAARGIWLLRKNVRKVWIQFAATGATTKIGVIFWSSAMWRPTAGFSGGVGIGNTGPWFLRYGEYGINLIPQATNTPTVPELIIDVPQGIFKDVDGGITDGFISILPSAATDNLTMQEIF